MRAAGLWARAELRRSWSSLLVMSVLAGLAAGAVVATVAGAVRAGSSVDRFEAATRTAHVTIFTDDHLGYHVGAALDADPRIAERAELTVMTVAPKGLIPGFEAVTAVGSELGGLQFRPWAIEGRLPRGGEVDAVAVTETSGERLGVSVGDRVDLEYFDQETGLACRNGEVDACDDRRSAGSARVVGVVRTPTDLAVNSFQQNVLVADDAIRPRLGDDPPIVGHIESLRLHRPEDAADVAAEYSVEIGDAGDVLSTLGDLDGPRRAVELQRTALLLGAAVAGLALAVTIGQAYGRHLARASTHVSTLAALGLRWRDRTVAGALPVLGVAALTTAVSVAVAIALSPIFPFGLARRADPDPGFLADWSLLALAGVAVAIATTLVGLAAAAVWARSSRATRHRAGRPSQVGDLASVSGLSPAQATGARWALVRERAARRLPVVSTLAAAAGAVGVVVGLAVLAVSLEGLLQTPGRYGASWEASVPVDVDAPIDDAARLASDPRIDEAALIGSGELTMQASGSPVQLPAVAYEHVAGRLDPVILEGRVPDAPDEVAVGSATYRELGIDLGDRVTLFGPGGTRRARVVGRVIIPTVGNFDVQRGAVVPMSTFDELGAAELIAGVDVDAYLLVRLAAGTSVAEYAADLADDRPARIVESPTQQAEVKALEEVELIPLLLGGFTAVVAVAAVANALIVSGRRRSGDIAVLRALGLRPRQAGEVVRWQGITIGAAALVLGIPLGLALGRLVWAAIARSVSVPVVIDLPVRPLLAMVVVTLAVAALIAIPPGRRVARLRPAELLRVE
jgi:ABC-type lipoprotein release transport system permease subunit